MNAHKGSHTSPEWNLFGMRSVIQAGGTTHASCHTRTNARRQQEGNKKETVMQDGHAFSHGLSIAVSALMAAAFLYLAFMPSPSLFAG